MAVINLFYSSKYLKSFKKLPFATQKAAVKKLEIFQTNPYDPMLKTHKLSGERQKYWSFSVSYSIRIMFEFIGEQTVGLVDIGPHSIYE